MVRFLGCLLFLITPLVAQNGTVFFGNLHSHTSYSDGSGKPADAFKHARTKAKVDFLVVSEHNHAQAEAGASADRRDGILIAKDHSLYTGPKLTALIPAARKATEDGKFLALYGQEFSSISKGNHVNVFDVDQVIDAPNGDFQQLVQWLNDHKDSTDQRPVIQFNHPELFDDESMEYGADDFETKAKWIAQMGQFVRLVEIVNGPAMTKTPSDAPPHATEDEFLRILNLGFRVAPTADQDNHYFTWGNASQARTAVIMDTLTKPQFLSALRQRHVYATEDPNLRIIFRVNGHLMGDVISPPAPNSELRIDFTIKDDDEPDAHYEIDVFSDRGVGGQRAKIIDTVVIDGNTSSPVAIEDIHFTGKGQYVFFRVRQFSEDGHTDRAWTVPVWFDEPDGPILESEVATLIDPATTAIASKHSKLYHLSDQCIDAKRIKPENRLDGSNARRGRRLHSGCPRTEQ